MKVVLTLNYNETIPAIAEARTSTSVQIGVEQEILLKIDCVPDSATFPIFVSIISIFVMEQYVLSQVGGMIVYTFFPFPPRPMFLTSSKLGESVIVILDVHPT